MKKSNALLAAVLVVAALTGCNSNTKKEPSGNPGETAAPKDEMVQQGETAVENAGKAKPPKGSITFTINGEPFSANENTVQCMFIGMGNKDMAQGMISGSGNGISVSGVMMARPQAGELKSKGVTSTTGLTVIKDGVEYHSMLGGDITINITRITPDGKNHYIGGTFSGTFKSKNGQSISITDGAFESSYL